MAETKTKPTEVSVDDFFDAVPDPQRREDAKKVRAMLERVSGEPARMWGPSIVGFGTCHYKYDSGREGDMPRTRLLAAGEGAGRSTSRPNSTGIGR